MASEEQKYAQYDTSNLTSNQQFELLKAQLEATEKDMLRQKNIAQLLKEFFVKLIVMMGKDKKGDREARELDQYLEAMQNMQIENDLHKEELSSLIVSANQLNAELDLMEKGVVNEGKFLADKEAFLEQLEKTLSLGKEAFKHNSEILKECMNDKDNFTLMKVNGVTCYVNNQALEDFDKQLDKQSAVICIDKEGNFSEFASINDFSKNVFGGTLPKDALELCDRTFKSANELQTYMKNECMDNSVAEYIAMQKSYNENMRTLEDKNKQLKSMDVVIFDQMDKRFATALATTLNMDALELAKGDKTFDFQSLIKDGRGRIFSNDDIQNPTYELNFDIKRTTDTKLEISNVKLSMDDKIIDLSNPNKINLQGLSEKDIENIYSLVSTIPHDVKDLNSEIRKELQTKALDEYGIKLNQSAKELAELEVKTSIEKIVNEVLQENPELESNLTEIDTIKEQVLDKISDLRTDDLSDVNISKFDKPLNDLSNMQEKYQEKYEEQSKMLDNRTKKLESSKDELSKTIEDRDNQIKEALGVDNLENTCLHYSTAIFGDNPVNNTRNFIQDMTEIQNNWKIKQEAEDARMKAEADKNALLHDGIDPNSEEMKALDTTISQCDATISDANAKLQNKPSMKQCTNAIAIAEGMVEVIESQAKTIQENQYKVNQAQTRVNCTATVLETCKEARNSIEPTVDKLKQQYQENAKKKENLQKRKEGYEKA